MPLSLTGFFTLLTTSLLLIFLLRSLLRKNEVILRTGTRIYLVLFVLMAVRLFIPFELGFEKTISVSYFLPWLRTAYLETVFSFLGCNFYLKDALAFCWVLGAAVAAFRGIRQYWLLKKHILACSATCDQAITTLLPKLNARISYNPVPFTVLQCPELKTPFVFGFFRPVIILPKVAMSKGDWRLILLHEMEHYYHGDLWVKLFFQVACIVHWWNPLVYVLRTQVGQLLEIINDRRVAEHLSQKQTFRYLSCILKIAKAEIAQPENFSQSGTAALAAPEHSRLSQRIHLGVDAMCTHIPVYLQTLFIVGLCALFFLSYAFVLEPDYICIEPDVFSFTSQNAYIIQNGDLFDVYYQHEYWSTVENPRELLVKLPIYSSESEVK